jgi:hypothetical protein
MKQKYHDFGDKIWAKFKLIRREIAAETCVIWKELIPNNHFPSGVGMTETLDTLKLRMFDKWQSCPTSKKSKQVYSKITMSGIYANWRPIWWETWKALGPAAGSKCSQVFMSECCGFSAISDAGELPSPLHDHYAARASASNSHALSRIESQRRLREEDRKNRDMSEKQDKANKDSKELKHQARAERAQAFLDLEVGKEKRKERQDEIARVVYLISRAESIGADTTALQSNLDTLYSSPYHTSSTPTDSSSSSLSQRSGDQTPFSPVAKFNLIAKQSQSAEATNLAQQEALATLQKAEAILEQRAFQTQPIAASSSHASTSEQQPKQQPLLQSVQPSAASSRASMQGERAYRRLLATIFSFETPRGGCLFQCFVNEFNDSLMTYLKDGVDHEFDVATLRIMVADEFTRFNGKVPGHQYIGQPNELPQDLAAHV